MSIKKNFGFIFIAMLAACVLLLTACAPAQQTTEGAVTEPITTEPITAEATTEPTTGSSVQVSKEVLAEHLVLEGHVPAYIGELVKCSSQFIVGYSSPTDYSEGYIIKVEEGATFPTLGIKYLMDENGTPDDRMESIEPILPWELEDLGAALPINSKLMGMIYIMPAAATSDEEVKGYWVPPYWFEPIPR